MKTIGSRLKEARKRKGLTQVDIQKATGISSGNLSDIENDKSMPSAAALISLSRELEVSIDWILTGEERFAVEPASLKREASGYVSIDLSPQEIEFFAKVRQLSKENRIKVEGIVEGLLISQDNYPQSRTGTSSRSTNGYEREESAAKSKLA